MKRVKLSPQIAQLKNFLLHGFTCSNTTESVAVLRELGYKREMAEFIIKEWKRKSEAHGWDGLGEYPDDLEFGDWYKKIMENFHRFWSKEKERFDFMEIIKKL